MSLHEYVSIILSNENIQWQIVVVVMMMMPKHYHTFIGATSLFVRLPSYPMSVRFIHTSYSVNVAGSAWILTTCSSMISTILIFENQRCVNCLTKWIYIIGYEIAQRRKENNHHSSLICENAIFLSSFVATA